MSSSRKSAAIIISKGILYKSFVLFALACVPLNALSSNFHGDFSAVNIISSAAYCTDRTESVCLQLFFIVINSVLSWKREVLTATHYRH